MIGRHRPGSRRFVLFLLPAAIAAAACGGSYHPPSGDQARRISTGADDTASSLTDPSETATGSTPSGGNTDTTRATSPQSGSGPAAPGGLVVAAQGGVIRVG